MNPISRRNVLQQLATLPLVNAIPFSLDPPPFGVPLTQINVIIQGLAIIAVHTTPTQRIEVLFPYVPSDSMTVGHIYKAGNFLGSTDNDVTDCDDLVKGETYHLRGITPGASTPQFESDRNMIFSGSQADIYIDPDQLSFCRLSLPFPSVGTSYSYRVAQRCKKNVAGACIPFNPLKPFLLGSGLSFNQGSSTQLALVHIFSYLIADVNKLQLIADSSGAPFKWQPRQKRGFPNSPTVNLLFYAEPDSATDGAHAASAFEILTSLLPLRHSTGKLDVHFDNVDPQGILPLPDNSLPDNIDPTTELETFYERKTATLSPANCVQAIVNP